MMKKLICLFVCSIMLLGNIFSSAMVYKKGQKGEDIKKVQKFLASKGYGVGSHGANGIFGKDTEAAVKKFQKEHGLDPDGMVGPATQKALFGSANKDTKDKKSDERGKSDNSPRINRILRLGCKGNDVKILQQALISKGYSVGPSGADGSYGPSTVNAVKNFQKDHGISESGIVGPATRLALVKSSGKSSLGVFSRGQKGVLVQSVQSMLIGCGYSLGASGVDGSYGPATENAVKQLQTNNNLPVTGIIDKDTFHILLAKTKRTLVPHDLPTIGTPNSVGEQYDLGGELKRRRFYGPDGRAVKDEDYSDHDNHKKHPNPHDHHWPGGVRDKEPKPHNPWPVPKKENSKSQHAKKSFADDFQKALNHAGQAANDAIKRNQKAMQEGAAKAAGAITAAAPILAALGLLAIL